MNDDQELEALLDEIGKEPVRAEARAIADETMGRFRQDMAQGDASGLVRPQQRKSRFIMTGQRISHWVGERPVKAVLALAACVLIVAGIWMVGDASAGRAYAAAIESVAKARTFSCVKTVQFKNGEVSERIYMFKEPNLERSEVRLPAKGAGQVEITDYSAQKRLTLTPDTDLFPPEWRKVAVVSNVGKMIDPATGDLVPRTLDTSVRDEVMNLRSKAAREAGAAEVNGHNARVLEATISGARKVTAHVDAATGQPLQIRLEAKDVKVSFSDIRIDEPLDDALFSLTPPAGYRAPDLAALAKERPATQTAAMLVREQLTPRMMFLLRECFTYLSKHNHEWPRDLSDLSPGQLKPEVLKKLLTGTSQPDARPDIVYRRPDPRGKATTTVVLYQAHEAWPAGGIWVGFMDGHCEVVTSEERFKVMVE